MKLLGIDSSGLSASAALLFDGVLIAEYTTNYKKTHSQTLLPMIDQIIKMTDTNLMDIDAIAVAKGPGSFTGLRIGSSTAKGLALVLDKPIIPVPTAEGLAYNLYGVRDYICPIMDARRNQVYTGIYEFLDGKFQIVKDQSAISIQELVEELKARGRNVTFLGDGVAVYQKIIEELLPNGYTYAPAHLTMQKAGSLCQRALILFEEGKVESANNHIPDYLRLSQAERERIENDKSNTALS